MKNKITAVIAALALTLSIVAPTFAADISETAQTTDPITFTVSVTNLDYPAKDAGTGNLYAPSFTTQSKSSASANGYDVWMKVNASGTGKIDPNRRLCLIALPSGLTASGSPGPCANSGVIDSAGWGGGAAGSTGTGVKIFGRTSSDTTLRTTTFNLGVQNLPASPLAIGSYTGTVTLTLMPNP